MDFTINEYLSKLKNIDRLLDEAIRLSNEREILKFDLYDKASNQELNSKELHELDRQERIAFESIPEEPKLPQRNMAYHQEEAYEKMDKRHILSMILLFFLTINVGISIVAIALSPGVSKMLLFIGLVSAFGIYLIFRGKFRSFFADRGGITKLILIGIILFNFVFAGYIFFMALSAIGRRGGIDLIKDTLKIILMFLVCSIVPFIYYIYVTKDIRKVNAETKEKNRQVGTYNKKIDELNRTYDQRYQAYVVGRQNYQEALDSYNKTHAQTEKQRDKYIKDLWKSYDKILYEKYEAYTNAIGEIFAEIMSELAGGWLPQDYWNQDYIRRIILYIEEGGANSLEEALARISIDEKNKRTEEKQDELIGMVNILNNRHYNELEEELKAKRSDMLSLNQTQINQGIISYHLEFVEENLATMRNLLRHSSLLTLAELMDGNSENNELSDWRMMKIDKSLGRFSQSTKNLSTAKSAYKRYFLN